jgi:hypothetical protein
MGTFHPTELHTRCARGLWAGLDAKQWTVADLARSVHASHASLNEFLRLRQGISLERLDACIRALDLSYAQFFAAAEPLLSAPPALTPAQQAAAELRNMANRLDPSDSALALRRYRRPTMRLPHAS